MNKPLVIKIGGGILEKANALTALFNTIKMFDKQPVVIVHGGGCVVDKMLEKSGFITEKKQGLRITPKNQIPYISGALAGSINKKIVVKANSVGITAVGLSLVDGELASCIKHPAKLGEVGVPNANNSDLLNTLLNANFLPIISSIGALADGNLVNVNADDAAVVICQLLNAELLLLTDVNGIKNGDGKYLHSLNRHQADKLISQGVITKGMTAKVNAALLAATQLRRSIAVASWQLPEQMIALVQGQSIGTRIQPD